MISVLFILLGVLLGALPMLVFFLAYRKYALERIDDLKDELSWIQEEFDELFEEYNKKMDTQVPAFKQGELNPLPEDWHKYTKKVGYVACVCEKSSVAGMVNTLITVIPDNIDWEVAVFFTTPKRPSWLDDHRKAKINVLKEIHAGNFEVLEGISEKGLKVLARKKEFQKAKKEG